MNYYMIKSKTKRECRLLLKQIHHKIIKISSIYVYNNNYYILISLIDNSVNLSYNDSFISIDNDNHYQNLQYSQDIIDIIKWAISELNQSIHWVYYETKSVLIKNEGRMYGKILRSFKPLTETMAIINYTSDSFSDGGLYNNIDNAIKQILTQISYGASVVDIGVESTRPNATTLDFTQELVKLKEIIPIVAKLKHDYNFKLSVDTYHSENIEYLLNNNVDIINDVSGNLSLNALKLIKDYNKIYIAMHSLSVPASQELTFSLDVDPVEIIYNWMTRKLEQLLDTGFKIENIVLDPGIGFGTNPAQSWYVLQYMDKFLQLPCEILVGHSRKSVFNHITEIPVRERDIITNYISCYLSNKRVDYIRLHDVELFYKLIAIPLLP